MELRDEITRARERRKLTKHDLAHATGLSYQHIHNVEVGHRPLTLEVLRKLHRCLRLPQRVLMRLFEDCSREQGQGSEDTNFA